MDREELRRCFGEGMTFEEAFDEACGGNTAFAVKAFETWQEFEDAGAERQADLDEKTRNSE